MLRAGDQIFEENSNGIDGQAADTNEYRPEVEASALLEDSENLKDGLEEQKEADGEEGGRGSIFVWPPFGRGRLYQAVGRGVGHACRGGEDI